MAELKAIFDHKLKLASSPHIHTTLSTNKSMLLVIAALLPSIISGVIFFGFYQLLIIAVSVGFAMLTEYGIKKIRKKEVTLNDGSAALTGLLLALVLPPNFSLVMTALGAIVAIAVGKEVFGGIGFNIFNPALVGRAFLQAAFPVPMTTWIMPTIGVDTISSATPLSSFKFDGVLSDTMPMFWGNVGGCIGETSSLAVLIGGLFLIFLGIANWRIPLSMIVGVFIFSGALWLADSSAYVSPIYHILGGGFLFGALFMATDWVSSPLTGKGMWIFGIGISLVVVLIRVFGGLPEGVMYAILFMNAFVPLINRYTKPKIFGAEK